jgi:hypothetical protein
VQVVSINVTSSDPAGADAFVRNNGLNPALDDAGLTAFPAYSQGGVPHIALINGLAGSNYRQWEILYTRAGYSLGGYTTLRTGIDSVTPEPHSILLLGMAAGVLISRRRRPIERVL